MKNEIQIIDFIFILPLVKNYHIFEWYVLVTF